MAAASAIDQDALDAEEAYAQECASSHCYDREQLAMPILHVCDICDVAVDEFCAEHPKSSISSIVIADDDYRLCCDRCGDTAAGEPEDFIDAAYLIDDPYAATGALCPACATDDDPQHIVGSWILSW